MNTCANIFGINLVPSFNALFVRLTEYSAIEMTRTLDRMLAANILPHTSSQDMNNALKINSKQSSVYCWWDY